MKIVILLRYPKAENNVWKQNIINELIKLGHEVYLLYGESSYWAHLKAGLKTYGLSMFKKKNNLTNSKTSVNLFAYFKNYLPVYKQQKLNSNKTERLIKTISPDHMLLLGTGIIRKNILNIPKKGVIHCHHGHLPKYRGVNTAEWSVFHNDDIYITTHFVDPGVDTGDTILERKIYFSQNDTIESIRKKCREESVQLILETFNKLDSLPQIRKKQEKRDGRQFFEMHPFLKELTDNKIKQQTVS